MRQFMVVLMLGCSCGVAELKQSSGVAETGYQKEEWSAHHDFDCNRLR